MVNSYAAFDCLYIGNQLEKTLRNFAEAEVHLFAYLACLLSLYRKEPVSAWGYGFSGTRNGSPFSVEINDATEAFKSAGLISSTNEYLVLTAEGRSECTELCKLSINKDRMDCLEGACSCLLTMPVGIVRNALFQEPMLKPAVNLSDARPLLERPGLDLLYDQFTELSQAIGIQTTDLMIPATVWLSYLSQMARRATLTEAVQA